jgi:hypothetical protein
MAEQTRSTPVEVLTAALGADAAKAAIKALCVEAGFAIVPADWFCNPEADDA